MPTISVGHGTADGFARFIDWCHALLTDKPGIQQHGEGSGSHTLTLASGPVLTCRRDPESGLVTVETADPLPDELSAVLREASELAAKGAMGASQWWRATFASRQELDATFGLQMMRMLGQRRAYSGKWRLGQDVLVEFAIENPSQLPAFAKQTITATFRSEGPGHGPRAARIARGQADVVRAVLSFITATTLDGSPLIRPVREPEFPPGSAVHPAIPELAIHDLPLWSRLADAFAAGGGEFVGRIVNALTAYEHALHQPTGNAATVFYVSSIEALATPNHGYEQHRATARFVETLMQLATPKLQETLIHANFAEAFGACSSPRKLAQRIYKLRSTPVHRGEFGLSRDCLMAGFSVEGPARAALLAEIAEAAIVQFARQPFTSLIGHLELDPSRRLELSAEEHEAVKAAAIERGLSTEDFILQALGLPPRSAAEQSQILRSGSAQRTGPRQ